MGGTPQVGGPWGVLSGAIAKKADEHHQKAEADKKADRDFKIHTIQTAIDAEMAKPPAERNMEQVNKGIEEISKLYGSKDAKNLFQKLGEVYNKVTQHQHVQGAAQPDAGPQAGGRASQPQAQPAAKTQAAPPGFTPPNIGGPSAASDPVNVYRGKEQVDADFEQGAPKRMKDGLVAAGLSEDEAKKIVAEKFAGPAGRPQKPKIGWGKDEKGFFSFAVDPMTNQPISGTEDRQALPPASYMEQIRQGHYFYVDDSGGVHEISNVTKSGKDVPTTRDSGNGKGTDTEKGNGKSAPPKLSKLPSTGAKTDRAGKAKTDVVGSKDTGVLSPAGQKVLMTTQPVLDQVGKLLGDIDNLKLGDNNTSGYLFTARAKYALGSASPEGTLAHDIAGLSLGSVVEAASALQGTSRSMTALKKALEHTPNPWVDSPKLIKEKLTTIQERLNDVVADANKYGRKRAVSSEGANDGGGKTGAAKDKSAAPPNMTPPNGSGPAPDVDKVLDDIFGPAKKAS